MLVAIIEGLEIRNYKALASVSMKKVGPFAVFLGTNGCGKSTLFDVFSFLGDCLIANVKTALAKRGGFYEVRSRGIEGTICITIKYRETNKATLMTYLLEIDQGKKGQVFIVREFVK